MGMSVFFGATDRPGGACAIGEGIPHFVVLSESDAE